MICEINGRKLRELIYMNGLTMAVVSRQIGFNGNYLQKCIKENRLSATAITRLYDKFQINPVHYVPGWKGES